jgi:hypothetical protein
VDGSLQICTCCFSVVVAQGIKKNLQADDVQMTAKTEKLQSMVVECAKGRSERRVQEGDKEAINECGTCGPMMMLLLLLIQLVLVRSDCIGM